MMPDQNDYSRGLVLQSVGRVWPEAHKWIKGKTGKNLVRAIKDLAEIAFLVYSQHVEAVRTHASMLAILV